MKKLNIDEPKSWHWVKRQKYIPAYVFDENPEYLKKFYKAELIRRIPIELITHEPIKYGTNVSLESFIHMTDEFYPIGWEPIVVDKHFHLIDGMLRLTFAKGSYIKYIDVLVKTFNDFYEFDIQEN